MSKLKLIHGTKTPGLKYRQVALDEIAGKTLQGVASTTVQAQMATNRAWCCCSRTEPGTGSFCPVTTETNRSVI